MHFMSLYPQHLYSNFHPSVCSIKPPNPGPVAGLCVRLRFHVGWPSFLCIWTNHFLLWRAWYLGNNIPCLGLSWGIEGRALESCFCVFGWLGLVYVSGLKSYDFHILWNSDQTILSVQKFKKKRKEKSSKRPSHSNEKRRWRGCGGKKADQSHQSKQGEGPARELGSVFRPWRATAVDCLWGCGSSREYEIGKRWLKLSCPFDCPWTSASSPVKNVWQLLAQNNTVLLGQPLPSSSNTLSQLVSVLCLAWHAALLMPWANRLSISHGKHKGERAVSLFSSCANWL